MLQERPLYITFFTGPNYVKRIEDELSRNLDVGNNRIRELIRFVGLYL